MTAPKLSDALGRMVRHFGLDHELACAFQLCHDAAAALEERLARVEEAHENSEEAIIRALEGHAQRIAWIEQEEKP